MHTWVEYFAEIDELVYNTIRHLQYMSHGLEWRLKKESNTANANITFFMFHFYDELNFRIFFNISFF